LRQTLVNLLGNAIKFTEIGTVSVRVKLLADDQPQLQFDIVDTGVGMTLDQQTRLFQPFTQADSSTTRNFGGTGLGLTISRRLAQILGGDVAIVYSTPGIGTCFRLTIAIGSLENLPGDADANEKFAETNFITTAHACLPPVACNSAANRANAEPSAVVEQPIPFTSLPLQASRILLAEDGPDNQRLISLVLTKSGADVTVVENGELAVKAALDMVAAGRAFDVILMDMQMPILDGYGAAKELRNRGYRGPIIALTAHAMSGDRKKCLAAGCDDFATKPIDRQQLIRQILAQLQAAPRPIACTN
jgi:CheY-like chemotaxis protein